MQDIPKMSAETMRSAAEADWNFAGAQPLREWLAPSQSSQDCERLRCLGNVVVPQCARLGLHIMVHEAQKLP